MRAHSRFLPIAVLLLSTSPSLAFAAEPAFQDAWGSAGKGNGQFRNAAGIALDDEGNIYVTDVNNSRVQKFSPDGVFLTSWGTAGTGSGEFWGPWAVAVAGGVVYVSDNTLNRIQKFTTDGSFLKKWGSQGTAPGQFLNPTGIAISGDGKVYVADQNNTRVQRFSDDGVYEISIGSRGIGPGKFTTGPQAVAFGPGGDLYVAVDREIHRFDAEGRFLDKWAIGPDADYATYGPTWLAIDGDGVVHAPVRGDTRNAVLEYGPAGSFLQDWGTLGSAPGDFDGVLGIAVAPSGRIYVVDSGNSRVEVFLKAEVPVKGTSWGRLKAGSP